MDADAATTAAIRHLVDQTYDAMSRPDGEFAQVFGHESIAVAGSGQGELFYGPADVISAARFVASRALSWVPGDIRVWRNNDVAWAQILGHVQWSDDGAVERVPYWTTGVFGRDGDRWQWLYWGGSEPQ